MCLSVSTAFENLVLVTYYLWFGFFLGLGGKIEKLDCINSAIRMRSLILCQRVKIHSESCFESTTVRCISCPNMGDISVADCFIQMP